MPVFRYSARGRDGVVAGVVRAVDTAAVAQQLANQHLEPLSIERETAQVGEVAGWRHIGHHLGLSRTPPLDDLILFSRQMFALTRAGVPLVRAFQGLQEHTHRADMRDAMGKIIDDLQSGSDLASAMTAHPKVFSRLFPRLIQVGETTGRLEEAFQQLSLYLVRDRDTRHRIRTAIRYPLFVLFALLVALFVINYFVIPAFFSLFARFGAELPFFTRVLMATSHYTQTYGPVMLLGALGGGIFFRQFIHTPRGMYWWDRTTLHLPLVGGIVHHASLARMARTFAMGFQSGLTVTQTLNTVEESVDNLFIRDKLSGMHRGVERGESLTQAAYHSGLFSPLVLQMLAVGEETGGVADMMSEVADFYDRKVAHDIQALSAAIEPILLFGVAILVLILALGVFLPMWNLGSVAFRHR